MKILVTGVTGQVGWELMRSLQPFGRVIGLNSRQFNLAEPDAMRSVVRELKPDLIVNPAAYTAVDKAEAESDVAMRINGEAPALLAEEVHRLGAWLIHYSTDYVFDGDKTDPYTESDRTNPKSVYGKTKLAGEDAIRASGCNHLIFRTSWVFASRGKNFLKTVLRLAEEREQLRIVSDQTGAPTSARLIADVTSQIAGRRIGRGKPDLASGTFNLTASGATSWHGLASAIIERAATRLTFVDLKVRQIDAITTAEYPLPAPRPRNSRLDCNALEGVFGITLPDWHTGLDLCMDEMAESLKAHDRTQA